MGLNANWLLFEKLDKAKLDRLKKHEYKSEGSTLLDPIMQPFWRFLVDGNSSILTIPDWWAPNAMTLIGLIFNVFTCSILIFYSPDAKQDIPSWALFLTAFALFVYQTLDACDGKQARKTKSSSPLGELFDHGCDAVSTIFVSLSVCLSVKLGALTTTMVVLCTAANSLFYTAHWQTYVTGSLKFAKFDVTEAQFTIIGIHLLSAIFGCSFWSTMDLLIPIPSLYLFMSPVMFGLFVKFCLCFASIFLVQGAGKNGSTVAIFGIELKMIPMLGTAANEVLILLCDLKAILSGGAGKNGSTVAGTSIISPVIPVSLVFTFTMLIYCKSPSQVFVDNVALYIVAFGFVTAKITNKLVIAHMSKSEMAKLDAIFLGPLLLFFNQYFNFYFSELVLLWISFIYILINFLCYSWLSCKQIASHLGVYVFTITSRPEPVTATNGRQQNDNGDTDNELYNDRLTSADNDNGDNDYDNDFEDDDDDATLFSARKGERQSLLNSSGGGASTGNVFDLNGVLVLDGERPKTPTYESFNR